MTNFLKSCFLFFVFLCVTNSVCGQKAIVRSLNPSAVQTGATAFPLVVSGSNFAKNSKVYLNGQPLETFQISWNKLRATVPASFVANPGNLQVKVTARNQASD